ncbi:[citrate (pro-3S)-lyase] ligase [Sporomusa acidovorans]|uniref:[Citrate [pro-3S]-lyase] ligase n=1 Tax=Sporomusa acidovorans (strain ATCC 49682 / DSM 3132 / Mol) TaxID=1123286 RepID=A0ABZ3J097_SPOA4|nr:[citrate (pro-3S)-lyase] ligase [Sporomusa acidovorans]OZC22800.1 [citrate [pro-3S]-lyase] ligase [Sporomusa acidovorans DSM 3132]SDE51352.1 [citrate (pro-3S)-lyase] ligase [Sporomusa acidovorans]
MWADYDIREINLDSPREVADVRTFLAGFDLTFAAVVDYTIAFYQHDKIIATGSLAGEVLRNIAVSPHLQGEGLTAKVVSYLIQQAGQRGIYHYFIYTKPSAAPMFTALGFKELARSEPYAVLLESGIGSIDDYCREIANKVKVLPAGSRAAVVVNCNPLTLGHKAVIAKAARENQGVVVLVVSEDKSLFPFDVRFRLVREGLAEFDNVAVLPAGKYIISAATFPGYFTRGEATIAAQTQLDAAVFARYIAPALGVTKRYVGEEPYCAMTGGYNDALSEILPQYGLALTVIPRITIGGEIISASRVREFIRQDNWPAIKEMVPDTTYHYLTSPQAQPIIERIKASDSRH